MRGAANTRGVGRDSMLRRRSEDTWYTSSRRYGQDRLNRIVPVVLRYELGVFTCLA